MTGLMDSLKSIVHRDSPNAKRDKGGSTSPKSRHQRDSSAASSSSAGAMQPPPAPQQPAPQSAQHAQYAAFAPEPASRSEARDFGAANPAAARVSPGLQAGSHSDSAARQRAEQLVEAERVAKLKLPKYEGLPSNFELLDKMGDGAFSNVYKANDTASRRKVAIKAVRKYELSSSQDGGKHLGPAVKKKPRATERANILKEVQIMRNLRHEGIVELHSFTESRDHYFLVLELMAGGELFHQIVKLTYFSEALSRHVIMQVASGIRYLHEEKGVVHRDIKPENLLFEAIPIIPSRRPIQRPYDEEKEDEGEFIPGVGGGGIGRVKIADFGLSKIVWNEETMTPCGTVGYTAPEIVKDERYSKSVDMWAMGCVLYTLLCGFPPFYDESINVLTEKVARGYYTFLSPWWDDISASSKDLITHLLCVDPDKRSTIDQFIAHPWSQEKPPAPDLTPTTLSQAGPLLHPKVATTAMSSLPPDSPMLQGLGGRLPRASPGIAQLREAFDVTYAVHRMEEEGARRRVKGGANRGFLNNLNEDDDEEDEAEAALAESKRKYGASVAQSLEQHRAAAPTRTAGTNQQQAYVGWGGADRKMAEAVLYDSGRAGTRDRGRASGKRGAGFELTLDKATLLGRRNKGDAAHGPMASSPLAQQ